MECLLRKEYLGSIDIYRRKKGLKNNNRYTQWHEKMDLKRRRKQGDLKFLQRTSKDYFYFLVAVVLTPLPTLLAIINGVTWIWRPWHFIDFVVGIMLVVCGGLILIGWIFMLLLLPFHKKRSQQAIEELQLLLQSREDSCLQSLTECVEDNIVKEEKASDTPQDSSPIDE